MRVLNKTFFAIFSLILISQSKSILADEGHKINATNPLIYTKLRFDDNYLQIYRRYQKIETYKEKKYNVKVEKLLDNNRTKEVIYKYYENPEVEATNITYDDLILDALDRSYKTRLMPSYVFSYDNEEDRRKASDPNLVSTAQCNIELDYLSRQMQAFQESRDPSKRVMSPEVGAFFDAYAGSEAGVLQGNSYFIGNWRQCYASHIFDLDKRNVSNTISFKGRYCIASLKSFNWGQKIKEMTQELIKNNYFLYPEQPYDYARFFKIQVGICLPESCDSRTIDSKRDEIRRLATHKLQEPIRSYYLDDLYCLPDETSELRKLDLSGWIFVLCCIVWTMLILFSTFCEYLQLKSGLTSSNRKTNKTKSGLEKMVSAMSLISNYRRLTETASLKAAKKKLANISKNGQVLVEGKGKNESIDRPKPSDLVFFNFFKTFCMPLMVYGHCGMFTVYLDKNVLDYDFFQSNFGLHFHSSGVFFVDWFFVMTGFITTYVLFSTARVEKNDLLQWLYTVFHRYWRLAPLYTFVLLFCQHIFHQTAYGPIWDYGTNNMTIRGICRRESIIYPLTMTSNLHPMHEECIMPSWYISNDFQFYLITPFILIMLAKWPVGGWFTTLGMIILCDLFRAHRYLVDPKAIPIDLMRPRNDLVMRNNWDIYPTYIYPHYRIDSYLVGILAGHYTYMVLSNRWNSILYWDGPNSKKSIRSDSKGSTEPHWFRKVLRASIWLTGCFIVASMTVCTYLLGALFPEAFEPYAIYFVALIYGTCHTVTSSGLSMMFVTFMFGQFKSLKELISHPFWTVASRYNFFVYLIQVEVIYWVVQSGDHPAEASLRDVVKMTIVVTTLCYAISIFLTFWLEHPLSHLEHEFVRAALMPAPRPRPEAGGSAGGDGQLIGVPQANHPAMISSNTASGQQSQSQRNVWPKPEHDSEPLVELLKQTASLSWRDQNKPEQESNVVVRIE